MITAHDLETISLFANMCEADRDRLARKAGDVRLAAGDWLFREGEHPYFQVLLEGQLSVHKNYLGRLQEMTKYGVYQAGDFFEDHFYEGRYRLSRGALRGTTASLAYARIFGVQYLHFGYTE